MRTRGLGGRRAWGWMRLCVALVGVTAGVMWGAGRWDDSIDSGAGQATAADGGGLPGVRL